MQIKLGERMRELRRRDSRTQEDLARALGVTSQAVSRWENGTCYPDMGLMPSIANYFGVSIDELFGYDGDRAKKIDELVAKIWEMNRQNNGVDVCVDECIRLAREGLVEFPGNDKLMLCLAHELYVAGYVRHGEVHKTDDEGYDIYDVERHRGYTEWQEAVKLYEKLLETLDEGDMRHQTVVELIQLYVNTGEHAKAAAIAEKAPSIGESREFLMLKTCDGKKRAEAHGEALLGMLWNVSNMVMSCIIMNKTHIEPAYAAQALKNAIEMYDLFITDGNYGLYNQYLINLNLYMSEFLWRAGEHDSAFDALYTALEHAKMLEEVCRNGEVAYTAPLISLVKHSVTKTPDVNITAQLPEVWSWGMTPDYSDVAVEIKADPRWTEWVKAAQTK